MENEKIIFNVPFYYEEIQSFAEANFGRELTDLELNRITQHWYENEKVDWEKVQLLAMAIEMAMDTKDNNWRQVDADFTFQQALHNSLSVAEHEHAKRNRRKK